MNRLARWPIENLTALDRQANALALGDGRLTISARTYYARLKGKRWAIMLGGVLDGVQAGHCASAARYDAALQMALMAAGLVPPLHPDQPAPA